MKALYDMKRILVSAERFNFLKCRYKMQFLHKMLQKTVRVFHEKLKLKLRATVFEKPCFLIFCLCLSGATPLLLLPENIRIRRFNLQTETYHDFLQEQERIMALDYDWDHNNTGLSKPPPRWSTGYCNDHFVSRHSNDVES